LFPWIISAVAFGGILIPKINLILGLVCREYYAERGVTLPSPGFGELPEQCRLPEVQARVAQFTMYGTLITGILSAFIAPRLGGLSDRYGRKKLMMLTNMGSLSGEIITIFAAKFPETISLWWILGGYFIDGLCGSLIASTAISHSYTTDCTAPDRRKIIFGYFHGALFAGIALGPLLAAWVIRVTHGVLAMFYISFGCHLTFIALLVFVIPESLSKAKQMAARDKFRIQQEALEPTNDWISYLRNVNFFEPLAVLNPKNDPQTPPDAKRNLVLLSAIDTILFGTARGLIGVILLYAIGHFQLNAETQSIFLACVTSMRVFCLLVILPVLTRIFRGKGNAPQPRTGASRFEINIIRFGIFIDIAGFIGYLFSANLTMFIASGMIASVGGIGSPTLQAVLTKHVPHDRVGKVLGGLGFLHGIGSVIGPLVFNLLYASTVRDFDRAIFILLIVMFGVVFVLSWLLKPGGKRNFDQKGYMLTICAAQLKLEEDEFSRRESVLPELDDDPLI
jgi:MFS family permease